MNMINRDKTMVNFINRYGISYFDSFIRMHMFFNDMHHIIIHRCRKSEMLFDLSCHSSYSFHITNKSHIKHSINFIKNQIMNRTNINDFLFDEIHQSSRCCNNNRRFFNKTFLLYYLTRSSKYTCIAHTIKCCQLCNFISYLGHKLSGRSKDKDLSLFQICINLIEYRQKKRKSLSCSCLRLSDNICSIKPYGQHFLLDFGRFSISYCIKRSQQSCFQWIIRKFHKNGDV